MGGQRWRSWLTNCLLVLGSVGFCLLALEAFLWGFSALYTPPQIPSAAVAAPPAPPAADDEIIVPPELIERSVRRRALLSMPEAWTKRPETVPGAAYAFWWHGALHVHDKY